MRTTPRPRPRPLGARPRFRPGLLLRRQPRLWWAVVLSAAVATGWLTAAVVASADQARAAWGTSARVVVAARDLEPGAVLHPSDVEVVARPAATLPDAALRVVPEHAVLTTAVFAGEVLVAGRLAPAGLTGVAATLPPGTRAVAIPTEAGMAPPLAVGDHVDVIVALPAESAGDGPPGFAVAADAIVVAIDDAAVTVAVPRAAAPRVAVALGQGAVTLALVGA